MATKKSKSSKKTPKITKKKIEETIKKHPVQRSAPKDKIFILVNGKKLKNIKELADVMHEIEDYVFHHHVTPDRNDFSNWLHHVFKEIDLAKEIAGCKSKDHVQLVLYRHISHKLWKR